MHTTAVLILCALAAWFAWRDGVELLIGWYSGAEPPLPPRVKVWIAVRGVLVVASGAAAIATL